MSLFLRAEPSVTVARPGEPAGRGGARVRVAVAAGRAASRMSRLAGRGSGEVIGGKVALALAPDLLVRSGRGRVLAVISGTNGKTTTTRLLSEAVGVHAGQTGAMVASNAGGANMPAGMATALFADGPAVLEVDELYLPTVVRQTAPRVVVLLNLTRDQLDRTAEMNRVAVAWRAALAGLPAGSTVVANGDDPRVVWAAGAAPRSVFLRLGRSWSRDGAVCPACGEMISYADPDRWACTVCEFAEPQPAGELVGDDVVLADEVVAGGATLRLDLRLPGRVNQRNAALATAAAALLGVPLPGAVAAMARVSQIAGRYAVTGVGGTPCRLLLAKNPAGWTETLALVTEGGWRPLLLAIESAGVDGRDTSWLYDVPFEVLAGRRVVVSGVAGADLALRLHFAGVEHVLEPDLLRAVALAGRDAGPVDTVGDYSSFQRLRRLAR